jgi:hypothetical protein
MRSYKEVFQIGFRTVEPVAGPVGRDNFERSAAVGRGRVWLSRRRGTFRMPVDVVSGYPKVIGERRWYWQRLPVDGYEFPTPGPTLWERLGFHQEHFWWGHQGTIDAIDDSVIPLWAVVAAFASLPMVLIGFKLMRRRRAMHCAFCSYNLTGNTSGVCPECGMAVEGKAGADA